jgi:hypothetical protein
MSTLSDILLLCMNSLLLHSVSIPGKGMDESYYTVKTDVVEGIGSNSPMSSVKSVVCGLGHRHHHHHRHHHIPSMVSHLRVTCFAVSIHVIQESCLSHLWAFLGNCSPYKTYYPFVLCQIKCAIRLG